MEWTLQILVYSWSIEDKEVKEDEGSNEEGAVEVKFKQETKICTLV